MIRIRAICILFSITISIALTGCAAQGMTEEDVRRVMQEYMVPGPPGPEGPPGLSAFRALRSARLTRISRCKRHPWGTWSHRTTRASRRERCPRSSRCTRYPGTCRTSRRAKAIEPSSHGCHPHSASDTYASSNRYLRAYTHSGAFGNERNITIR